MAGDWIKWSVGLESKREIVRLAGVLGVSREVAVCRCMKFWEWCDQNIGTDAISNSGSAFVELSPHDGDNMAFVDDLVGTPKFAETMALVGWIRFRNGRLELPNFGRHNGETAKTRARNAKNQKIKRVKMSPRRGDKTVTRGEKRRVTKDPPSPPFESERFRQAWTNWEDHRRQKKKPLTPTTIVEQFKYLASLGESEAIKTLEFSTRQGWEGLYPPKDGSGGRASAPEIDADAEFRRKETIRFRKEQLEREAQIAKERAEANNDPPAF